jgi:beta-glucosidase
VLGAYVDAKFPPGERRLDLMMRALHNMLLAHRQAYTLIKERYPDTQVGIAHNFMVFKRARPWSRLDRQLRRMIHYIYNIMVPESFVTNRLRILFPLLVVYNEPIRLDNQIDFWGINYYCRAHVRFTLNLQRPFKLLFVPRAGHGLSDLGWETYPKGLLRVCRWLDFTNKPLYVTENGIASDNDRVRIDYLEAHLRQVERARQKGFPMRGYYHWTLLDNYEWLVGNSVRFGLCHVDYDNDLSRTLKPSANVYREYIRKSLGKNE